MPKIIIEKNPVSPSVALNINGAEHILNRGEPVEVTDNAAEILREAGYKFEIQKEKGDAV